MSDAPPNLSLISPRPEHAVAWLAWRGEEATVRHNPLQAQSVEQLQRRIETSGSDLSMPREDYLWIACLDAVPIGTASLSGVSREMGYAEIGYLLTDRHHGKGMGTALVRKLVEKVFRETALRKLVAYTAEENQASWRLLERLGFVREGRLREHYVIEGKPVNELLYGLLRSDWEKRK